jgi:hypothetical protein
MAYHPSAAAVHNGLAAPPHMIMSVVTTLCGVVTGHRIIDKQLVPDQALSSDALIARGNTYVLIMHGSVCLCSRVAP